jgi:allantoate deiminase/N-carbamoyl-L-amino-acid hydrolase
MTVSESAAAGAAVAPLAPGAFGGRILELADRLAKHSETPGELTCTYLTPAHRAAAAELRDWMLAAGMQTEIDLVGNVVGRYASARPAARTLLLASHYDTVRNAGRYDGRLGILTALVVVEHLARAHSQLPFHIELAAFSEEEGVRFGTGYIGSSAVAGHFDSRLLGQCDANGISLGDLIRSCGGDPGSIPKLARRNHDLLGYLEVHIEQGPVLLAENLPVGIVTAIAGCVRQLVTIVGAVGHAGTVPMSQRHDAAAAAAEIVLAVERHCARTAGVVGTVGRLSVPDGVINVIPGRCELSLDIRGDETAKRDIAVANVRSDIERIGRNRGVAIEISEVQRTPAVACSPRMQDRLAQAVARAEIRPHRLPSGAGHDAVSFNGLTEIGMLFVRCGNGGISHSPRETVAAEDVDVAARILLDTILNLEPLG